MTVQIQTINLLNNSLITNRSKEINNARSIHVNDIDGGVLTTEPLTNLGTVYHYPQNPNNTSYTTNTIKSFKGYNDLDFPTDAKFDSIRNKIWIADASLQRVLSIATDDYSVITETTGINLPCAVCPNLNNGGCFILAWESVTEGKVIELDANGVILATFIFPYIFLFDSLDVQRTIDFVNSLSSPYSIAYDHKRGKVWWVADTIVYNVDTVSKTISAYDLTIHGFTGTRSIEVDFASGNAFVVTTDNTEWFIAQMLNGNSKYLGRSWVGEYVDPGRFSVTKIVASDSSSTNKFGFTGSIDGDYAVVGANRDDEYGVFSGASYVYNKTGVNIWDSETKLVGTDTSANDFFGTSVSISDDYLIVGAYGVQSQTGAAYIFRRTGLNTWDAGTKIIASDSAIGDQFGYSVAISGDYAIVGANRNDDGGGLHSGSAYIFRRTGANTWDAGTKIVASDSVGGQIFGFSVGIDGDYVIVGAPGNPSVGPMGSAYAFRRTGLNTWDTGIKIVSTDIAISDYFGFSVSIYGDYSIVGAPYKDNQRGAGYIFRRTGVNIWDTGTKFELAIQQIGDNFGRSVHVGVDSAIIGAPFSDNPTINEGSIYLYRNFGIDDWGSAIKMESPIPQEYASFGQSIDTYNNYILVGEDNSVPALNRSGSVYIYKLES